MYNGFKEYLFLVVDNETNGVLTRCVSASCANAVAKGMINSSVMVVKFPFLKNDHAVNRYQDDIRINYKLVRLYSEEKDKIKPLNPDSEANNYQYSPSNGSDKPFDLVQLDNKIIDSKWISRRKLANLRSKHIRNLESICERHLARFKSFVSDETFFQYLSEQLSQTNPELEEYPNSIKEWAEIYGVSYLSAYNELKMMYESTGIAVMRLHAIWSKYVDYINSKDSEDGLSQLYQNIETELVHGAR